MLSAISREFDPSLGTRYVLDAFLRARPGFTVLLLRWCGRQELNLHIFRYQLLRLARLPIPPRPQGMTRAMLIARTAYVVPISQESPMLRNYEPQGT